MTNKPMDKMKKAELIKLIEQLQSNDINLTAEYMVLMQQFKEKEKELEYVNVFAGAALDEVDYNKKQETFMNTMEGYYGGIDNMEKSLNKTAKISKKEERLLKNGYLMPHLEFDEKDEFYQKDVMMAKVSLSELSKDERKDLLNRAVKTEKAEKRAERLAVWQKRTDTFAALTTAGAKTLEEKVIQPAGLTLGEEKDALKDGVELKGMRLFTKAVNTSLKIIATKHMMHDKNPEVVKDPWLKIATRGVSMATTGAVQGIKKRFGISKISEKMSSTFKSWNSVFKKHLGNEKEELNNNRESARENEI